MKLQDITIKGFRGFSNITIPLHKNITVLVGKNGAGKSSVLDCIGHSIKFLSEHDDQNIVRYFEIAESDVNIERAQHSVSLIATFLDPHSCLRIEFKKDMRFPGRLMCNCEQTGLLSISKSMIDNEKAAKKINVFAYYSPQRSLQNKKPSNTASIQDIYTRDSVFGRAFEPSIDFATSLLWFDAKDALEARTRGKLQNLEYVDQELHAARIAICEALDGNIYTNPHMDGTPPKLYITDKNTNADYLVEQLSDGYKTMLALILDLSRRMATAQALYFPGQHTDSLAAPGIVLIDEVELHLHPSWQQSVLPTLTKIFPNIQFIVSTHSPQVVTSVKPECVLILQDGTVVDAPISTYGADTSPVLQEIFGVSPRPTNDATEKLRDYLEFIDSGKGTSNQAIALRENLELLMPGDPILATADRMILREERRRERMGKNHA